MANMVAMAFDPALVPGNDDELLGVLYEAISLLNAGHSSIVAYLTQRYIMPTGNIVRTCSIKLMTAFLPVTGYYAKRS